MVALEAFTAWPRRVQPGVAQLLARLAPGLLRATLSNTNSLPFLLCLFYQ